jgi:hypothetical protein
MNIVSFGAGTNSTAMIIGMYEKQIPVDLILFADTGAEMPHTYTYIEIMDTWLKEHGMPTITIVRNVDKDGNRLSLEMECLKSKSLPSIAYGYKKCSLKHKIGPQDKFCNNYQPCIDVWARGEKVFKYIGYDAGEQHRMYHAAPIDALDKKFSKVYALIEWGWYREDCIAKIIEYGLPLPGKSSCFFCPSMKKVEIKQLKKQYPELFQRAIEIEDNAKENLLTVKGLGRNYSWKGFIEGEEMQIGLCAFYENDDMPCGCYDG